MKRPLNRWDIGPEVPHGCTNIGLEGRLFTGSIWANVFDQQWDWICTHRFPGGNGYLSYEDDVWSPFWATEVKYKKVDSHTLAFDRNRCWRSAKSVAEVIVENDHIQSIAGQLRSYPIGRGALSGDDNSRCGEMIIRAIAAADAPLKLDKRLKASMIMNTIDRHFDMIPTSMAEVEGGIFGVLDQYPSGSQDVGYVLTKKKILAKLEEDQVLETIRVGLRA